MGIIASILLIIISIAHIIYGEKKQIPALKQLTKDSIHIGSLRIMIIQGGVILFAVGIIQLLISLDIINLTGIARYFPVGIILMNTIVAFVITLFFHREIFKITIPQYIVFCIIIGLQFFSIL